MEHTPGPLNIKRIEDNTIPPDYAIIDDEGKVIGEAFGIVGPGGELRPAGANARLWAQSPDLQAQRDALLAALENVMTQLRRLRDEKPMRWDTIVDPGIMDAWDQARAAIAGARGE